MSGGNAEASFASLESLSEDFTTSVSGSSSSSNFPLLVGIVLLSTNFPPLSATQFTVSTLEMDLKFLSSAPNYKVNSI